MLLAVICVKEASLSTLTKRVGQFLSYRYPINRERKNVIFNSLHFHTA